MVITADKLSIGKYVLAAFRGIKTTQYLAGIIHFINNNNEETVVVSFYKSVGNKQFVVAVVEDISTVDICDLFHI